MINLRQGGMFYLGLFFGIMLTVAFVVFLASTKILLTPAASNPTIIPAGTAMDTLTPTSSVTVTPTTTVTKTVTVTNTKTVTKTLTVTLTKTPTTTVTTTSSPTLTKTATVTLTPTATEHAGANLIHHWIFDGAHTNNDKTIEYDQGNGSPIQASISNAQYMPVDGRMGVQIAGKIDSYVSFGKDIGNFGTNDFTVTFWLYLNGDDCFASGKFCEILGNRNNESTNDYFSVRTASTGKLLAAEISSSSVYNSYTYTKPSAITSNRWYNIAVIRHGSTLQLYVDGQTQGSNDTNVIANITGSNLGDFRLGPTGLEVGNLVYAKATLRDLRIYNIALTPDDIAYISQHP